MSNILEDLRAYRLARNKAEGVDPSAYTEDQADKAMCGLLAHTTEELFELLMCINRKAWKPMPSIRGTSEESQILRTQALEELADVLLMLHAFTNAAGITEDEVLVALRYKTAKNLARLDHICNQ